MKSTSGFLFVILFTVFNFSRSAEAGLQNRMESCEQLWGAQAPRALFLPEADREPGVAPTSELSYRNYRARLEREGFHRKKCLKDWLILIEMDLGKDKDLLPYAYSNLLELEAGSLGAGSSVKADVLVQFRPPQNTLGRLMAGAGQRIHVFPSRQMISFPLSEKQFTQIGRGDIQSPPVESAHSSVEQFVQWGREAYPAKNVLLIYWGHGSSWQDSARFAWRAKQKVDLIACDSCLMQSVEGACQLAPCCDLVSGCESIQGYPGLPYAEILSGMNQGSSTARSEPRRVADLILDAVERSFYPDEAAGPVASRSTRNHLDPDGAKYFLFSTVETSSLLRFLLPALDGLADALGTWMDRNPTAWAQVKRLIQKGEAFRNGNQDLGLFLRNLWELVKEELENGGGEGVHEVVRALSDLQLALGSTVVKTALGTKYLEMLPKNGTDSQSPSESVPFGPVGLGIWLPPSDFEYHQKIKGFAQSDFFKRRSSWVKFLARMYPDGFSLATWVRTASPKPAEQ